MVRPNARDYAMSTQLKPIGRRRARNQSKPLQSVWVAVRVERGFVSEARVFKTYSSAQRAEQRWRTSQNADYDESAVLQSELPN